MIVYHMRNNRNSTFWLESTIKVTGGRLIMLTKSTYNSKHKNISTM